MANKSGMSFDTSDFERKGMKLMRVKIPEYYGEGAKKLAPRILADAIKKQPRAPHATGNLWRTQTVGRLIISFAMIEIIFGFAAKYAAAVHEMPDNTNWTLKGSGPKYLEKKLTMFVRDYMQFLADFVKGKGR